MKKLKILFVINSLGRGGTERSLAESLPHLVQANIEPLIAYFHSYADGVENDVKQQGLRTYLINKQGLLARVNAVRHLIVTERPHLIHTAIFESDLAGRFAAIGSSVPVLTSLVNVPYTSIRFQDPNINPRKLRWVQMIDAWTARHLTHHFHAVSHAVRDAAVTTMSLSVERITVIQRGRNPQRLGLPNPMRRHYTRTKFNLQEHDEILLNVGRHEYQKGQRYLIDAMEQLAQCRPQLMLLIAGRQGHATSELEAMCNRAGLSKRIHFLGHRDDVPELLAAADLFVFPSLYEGMPGAVIEAMALGLPVVASDIAPVREVVEEGRNALLVEPKAPDQLATAINCLLSNQTRLQAFGQRSRHIFEEQFTLERSAQRMTELYHIVAEMKR
jgi:glycosyltransferase involved in cell wall biosynthesis